MESSNYKLKRNIVLDILIPSPGKPFCTNADDNYSISSKRRRKSGVSELTERKYKTILYLHKKLFCTQHDN